VYWLGMSLDIGSGAGHDWTHVFTGTIRNDLTIVGRWGDVPFNHQIPSDGYVDGSGELHIDFDNSDDVERPVLRGRMGEWDGLMLAPEESVSPPIDIEGTFGGSEFCSWVEANGQRYELNGVADLTIRRQPISVQDWSGNILARVGDPIRVRGRVSPLLGSGCADTSIMVEALTPTP
jgi:hypothetical protein